MCTCVYVYTNVYVYICVCVYIERKKYEQQINQQLWVKYLTQKLIDLQIKLNKL